MTDDPDFSFLSRHGLRQAPTVSDTFNDRVLDRVESCRRRSANQRALVAGILPLIFIAFGFISLNHRTNNSRESAAQAGTAWLLARQQPNGGWSVSDWGGHEQFSRGVGALATLALLYSPEGAPSHAVAAADQWLIQHFDPKAPLCEEGPNLYNHLFSLHTLLEIDSRHPSKERRAILRQAVSHLLRQQQGDGGWGYTGRASMGYSTYGESKSNSAITWWVLRILRQSENLDFPNLQFARDRGNAWIERCFQAKNGPTYHAGSNAVGPDMALFWMARLTHPRDSGSTSAALSGADSAALSGADAYRDLFLMRALAREAPFIQLIQAQQADGAWYNPNDRWAAAGGRIYTTAASVLALVPSDGRAGFLRN